MKKLLFITPKLSTGGANTSLDSLYLCLKKKYNIEVFSISHQPISHDYSFREVLLPRDKLLSYMYSNVSSQKCINKIIAYSIKAAKNFFLYLGVDIGFKRYKRVADRLERNNSYDCVIGFMEGYATQFASVFSNTNKVAWIHCNYNKYLPLNKSEEAMYSLFRKIVCVSDYTASVFTDRYPSLSDRTLSIHNLIDSASIIKLSKEDIQDKQFVTNGFTLLSVGRFVPVKRFRMIPAIAADLKARGRIFKWYVLGPQQDENEFSLFTDNLEKYDVSDCVKWLGGKSNPYPYYLAASIYVCLSESEACPMVFKEAQLLGVPIVTTDFPSSKEFIREVEGIIAPVEELSDAVSKMMQRLQSGFRLQQTTDNQGIVLEKLFKLFDGIA